jgi:hypothetical protein
MVYSTTAYAVWKKLPVWVVNKSSGEDVKRKKENCMKKNSFFAGMFGMVLAFGMLIVGCATKYRDIGVYDSSYPQNQQCTLMVPGTIAVPTMDGDTVYWRSMTKVIIPAGIHELTYNYQKDSGSGGGILGLVGVISDRTSAIAGEKLSFNFQANETYTFKIKSRGAGFGKPDVSIDQAKK